MPGKVYPGSAGPNRHVIGHPKWPPVKKFRCHRRFTPIALTLGAFWPILAATIDVGRNHDELDRETTSASFLPLHFADCLDGSGFRVGRYLAIASRCRDRLLRRARRPPAFLRPRRGTRATAIMQLPTPILLLHIPRATWATLSIQARPHCTNRSGVKATDFGGISGLRSVAKSEGRYC